MKNVMAWVTFLLTAITSVLAVGVILYWTLIDVDPPTDQLDVATYDINGLPRSVFRPGEVMVIKRNSCVKSHGEAIFTRVLRRADGLEMYFLPSGPQHLDVGCRESFNEVALPPFIGAGVYDYKVAITFANNPLVTTEQVLPMPRIEIVK